jgi:hypothetical protein
LKTMMKLRQRLGTTAIVLSLLAACERGGVEPGREEPAGARVGEMLYRDGLMAVPEVNARMREAVLAIDRDGLPADSVLADLEQWLDTWAAAHPQEVAGARAAVPAGNPGQPVPPTE